MRVAYGWIIVAVTVVTFALVIGGSLQSFGLFVLPVSQDLGLTRAEVNTGAILLNVGMAFASPIIGRLIDRFPARLIMLTSGVVFGASLTLLGLSASPFASALLIALPLAAAVVGCGTLTSPALVSQWFSAHRARALAISTLGISIGPIIMTPLISAMIQAWGWRRCLLTLGPASGLLIVAMAVLLVREAPAGGDAAPASVQPQGGDGTEPAAFGLSLGQLLRLPQFWTIAVGCALVFAILTADLVSLVPLMQGNGFSPAKSASLMSIYGIFAVVGALIFAWIGDRLDQAATFAAMAALIGVANLGLFLSHGYLLAGFCAGCIGFTGGMTSPGFMALIVRYFGTSSFGIAVGSASFLSTFVSAAFVRFGGDVFDATGSYDAMLLAFLVCGMVAGAILLATLRIAKPVPA